MIPALWRFGPVTVANHIRDDNMGAIARRILAEAPPRFALAGHSMGGYIAFEIIRQAPERVAKLALMNTQARPDTPEATVRRRGMIGAGAERRISRRARRAVSGLRASVAARRRDACANWSTTWPTMSGRKRSSGSRRPCIGRAELAADAGVDQMPDAGPDRRSGQHRPEFAVERDGRTAFPAPKLVILPDCGHLSQLEQPQATADALVEWLRN